MEIFENLRKVKHEVHSPEWFEFRKNHGIGASEVGTICGVSNYRPSIPEVFSQKVGMTDIQNTDNRFMLMGRILEPHILKLWEHYDGTEEGFVDNYNKGKVIREAGLADYYLINDKYPHLFCSLDGVIMPGGTNLLTGEVLDKPHPLEIKSISGYAAKMYEGGLPPTYLFQAHQQMLITETDYMEFAVLVDGRDFKVIPVEREQYIIDKILDCTKDLWYDRVLPAREYYSLLLEAQGVGNKELVDEITSRIQDLEPEPDSSEGYKEYMNEQFLKEVEQVSGQPNQYKKCRQIQLLRGVKKKIEEAEMLLKNQITKDLVDLGAEKLDFSELGYVKYYLKRNAKNHTLDIRIKEKPDPEAVDFEANKIDLNAY